MTTTSPTVTYKSLVDYAKEMIVFNRILCPASRSPKCSCATVLDSASNAFSLTNIAGVKFITYQSIYCLRDAPRPPSQMQFQAMEPLLRQCNGSRFVVRYEISDIKSVFMIFATPTHYKQFYEFLPSKERAFHEIIFGECEQRFKVDIDFGNELIVADSPLLRKPFYDKLTIICDTIKSIFENLYSSQHPGATNSPLCICETKGEVTPGKIKIGFHVTIGGRHYAQNVLVVREFIDLLTSELPPDLSKYIDRDTNKTIQNWRILGCNKYGQPRRIKRIFAKPMYSTSPSDAIVGNYTHSANIAHLTYIYTYSTMLSLRPTIAAASRSTITAEVHDRLIIAANALLTEDEKAAFANPSISGNFVNYRRFVPSYCDFCKRIHEKDNTLYFALLDNGSLVKFCRHNSKK